MSVRVEDAAGNPAAGARVEFVAPDQGAGGTFADGSTMISVTADQTGTADVMGFRPNNIAGSFVLIVTAFYQGSERTVAITQTNVSSDGPKRWIAILAGAGGAAAAVVALRSGSELTPPDLTVSKTASASIFLRGSTGTFILTVTNSGGTPTSGTVTLTDPLPSGLMPTNASGSGWTCSITGQTVNCTRDDGLNAGSSYPAISVAVNVASDAAASLTNTATVSGGGDDTPATGSVTVATEAGPDLTILKTASASIFVRGGTGSFTLTVTNHGGNATNGTVTVTDPLPPGLTPTNASGPGWTCSTTGQMVSCTRADALSPGASYPPISVAVNIAADAAASLTNSATVSGGGDNTPATGSVTVGTATGPDLIISKTAGTSIFVRGSAGTFTLTVTNIGGTATNGTVTVSDPLPSGLTLASANGDGWTCPITGQTVSCTRADVLNAGAGYPPISIAVNVASDAAGPLTNTATVSGGGDNTPATGSVTVGITTGPDLTISKTASPATFTRLGTGTFTLTVTNIGGTATSGPVTVTDPVPSGFTPTNASGPGWMCSVTGQMVSCTRPGVLNAGASYPPISITGVVALLAPASLTNTATVSGGGDSTPATGSVTVNVANFLSLSVTQEVDHPVVAPGDTVGFSLGISNPTEVPLTAVTLDDTLPPGFAYTAGSARIHIIGPSGEYAAGQAITPAITADGLVFPIGVLPAGSRVAIRYAAVVTSKAAPGELQSRVVGTASSPAGEPVRSAPVQARLVVTAGAFTLNQVLVGRVFEDINRNGTFDIGEPGVANVRVVTSSGQAATTDSDGQYNLPSLAAGSVTIAVDPATVPPGMDLPPNETRLGGAGRLLRTPLGGGAMLRQNFALIRTSPASMPSESGSPGITGSQEAVYGAEAARLEIIVERPIMAAGGYDRQLIRIRAFDHSGQAAANTPVVVTTVAGTVMAASDASDRVACESVLSLDQHADLLRQVVLETDRGEAAACLISGVIPSTTRLTVSGAGDPQLRATADVRFEAARRPPLLVAFGELGIGLSGRQTQAALGARRVDGQMSIFYQDSVTDKDLLTVAVRSGQGINSATGGTGLFEFDPTQRLYPVMGDASTHQQMAQSTSRLYARYDRGRSYLMYGDLHGDTATEGSISLLEYNRNVTGMRFRIERENRTDWLEGQAARPKTAYMREVSTALAGSAVRLSRSQIIPGSESITLEVRDRRNPERILFRETLIRNLDYALDPLSGVLFMMRPIGLFDSSLNLVQLVSAYEYQTAGADSAVYLGRGSYSINELGLRFGVSALTQNESGLHFAVGGLGLQKELPNGGWFQAEMPFSHGRLLANPEPSSSPAAGACCDLGVARNGGAVRAGFEQPLGLRNTILRGQFARTDEGFFNPYGSITVKGQQFRAISVETRGFESGQLSFGIRQEMNRNAAVDNERQTLSAKLTQTLRENLVGEAGIDQREFKDRRSDRQIDSYLISMGLRWEPFSRVETSVVREQNIREADPTYPNQTWLGAQFNMTPASRLFATHRASSAAIVPIGGVETSGLFSPESTRETAVGVESRLRPNTSMTMRYRMDSGAIGTDSFAVLGMLTRVPVRPGLSIDWALDHAVHLAGTGRGYIGGSVGVSHSKDDTLQISARYELRRRGFSENIFTAGVIGRLTPSMSALARYRMAGFGTATASQINGGQLALALRPRQSDRVAMLFSYDHGFANSLPLTGAANNRRTSRLSADGLLEVRQGLEFYSRAAVARTPGLYGGTRQAIYLQGRLQQSLSGRFDIAGEARWIQEAANISGTFVTAVEWGTWITPDFRIGLGYSPAAFSNPGALLNSTAARGGAYLVISSRLSTIFDLLGGSNRTKAASPDARESVSQR